MVDTDLVTDMSEVRRIASLVLEARQRAGIKVRQPLAKVTLADTALEGKEALLDILASEVNVKMVAFGSGFDSEVHLDTELTPELKQEGAVRDLVRAVQDLRKKAQLSPEDTVTLTIEADEAGEELVAAARPELERVAGVAKVNFGAVSSEMTVTVVGCTIGLARIA
jgi:isoleucyl-tRNA synthetase